MTMSNNSNLKPTIGIIGGTGKEGKGLAYRWAKSGYKIIIGSRQLEKAENAAREVKIIIGENANVCGKVNTDTANEADVIVLTVPFSGHQEMLNQLKPHIQGKILIDVTVPLVPPQVTKVQMPEAGSATLESKRILGEGVQVLAAFQNISYENLLDTEEVDCDILVCGGNKESRETVLILVQNAGLTGWDAGPIENSVVLEGFTSILIGINKKYGSKSAGIKITGVSKKDA